MNNVGLLLLMIFCHIVDDYKLQGILASMKQKDWWVEQIGFTKLYKYDYIVALLVHSFSWSFMILLPFFITSSFNITPVILGAFCVNIVIHAVVDDLKANKKKINLWVDQLIHLIQIIATWIFVTK